MIKDLKPLIAGPSITPNLAFTLAQLIVYRIRDERGRTEDERAVLTRAADLIDDVAKTWREI